MKNLIIKLAALMLIPVAALAACSKPSADLGSEPSAPAKAATAIISTEAQASSPAVSSEETEAPAAEAPDTDDPAADPAAQPAAEDNADKAELTANQWILSEVYVDGEKYRGNYYGSIISQTGAYISFNDDDTFSCILGYPGCSGTYTVNDGEITLHITTVYDGRSDGIPDDRYEALTWDKSEDSIRFDFNDVTNVFEKRIS